MSAEDTYYEVLAYLQANMSTPVFDGDVMDDNDIPEVGGIFKPYVVLSPGDIESARSPRLKGIIGTVHDPIFLDIVADCIAPNPGIANRLRGQVSGLLHGWKPTGSSEITMGAYRGYSEKQDDLKPTIYHRAALYRTISNL